MPEPPAASPPTTGRLRRTFRIALRALALLALLGLVLTWLSTDHLRSFGGPPNAASLARMRASPHFVDGRFVNGEPTTVMAPGSYFGAFREWLLGTEMRVPPCPLPMVTDTAARLAAPAASGLRITWLGHSTTLIEIDGATLLTDPMWGERASPSHWVG